MKILNDIVSGKRNSLLDAKAKSMDELKIEENIVKNKYAGMGEFTLPSGQIKILTIIFQASMVFGKLPIWIHVFNPLTLQDIKEIDELSKAFPDIPVILGHMGGSNWLTAIELAKEIPNLYLDTSAYFSTLVLKITVNEVLLKCIFGVDMPYGDY